MKACITTSYTRNNRKNTELIKSHTHPFLDTGSVLSDEAFRKLFGSSKRKKPNKTNGKSKPCIIQLDDDDVDVVKVTQEKARERLIHWITRDRGFNIAGTSTLKQGLEIDNIRRGINRDIGELTACRMLAAINKWVYGASARRYGKTINAAFFYEENQYFSSDITDSYYDKNKERHIAKDGRKHLHFIISLPKRTYDQGIIGLKKVHKNGQETLEGRYLNEDLYKAITKNNEWVHTDHVFKPVTSDFGWGKYCTKEGTDALIPSATRFNNG